MPLSAEHQAALVKGVGEDLQLFAQTKENGQPSEDDVINWRSGYIAGYQRAVAIAQELSPNPDTSLQE
jgi:hypothetical protein